MSCKGSTSRQPDPLEELSELLQAIGLDVPSLRAIGRKIGAQRSGGKVEVVDVLSYISQNPNDPDVKKLMVGKKSTPADVQEENSPFCSERAKQIKSVDWYTLPHLTYELWQIKAEPVKVNSKMMMRVSCVVKVGPRMNFGDSIRWQEDMETLPSAKQLETFIKISLAAPYPGFKPGYPEILQICSNMEHHALALSPFLSTFKDPFHWNIERRDMEEITNLPKKKCMALMDDAVKKAEVHKQAGNEAYRRGDGVAAAMEYEKGVEIIDIALYRLKTSAGQTKVREVERFQSIIFANCSAARMLPGRSYDPGRARDDGEEAIRLDSTYPKAYMRLSKAHEALKNIQAAQEAVAKALRTSELQNNVDLVNRLIHLQTNGKGFSTDMQEFAEWLSMLLRDDPTSASMMGGVEGLYWVRVDEHAQRFPRS